MSPARRHGPVAVLTLALALALAGPALAATGEASKPIHGGKPVALRQSHRAGRSIETREFRVRSAGSAGHFGASEKVGTLSPTEGGGWRYESAHRSNLFAKRGQSSGTLDAPVRFVTGRGGTRPIRVKAGGVIGIISEARSVVLGGSRGSRPIELQGSRSDWNEYSSGVPTDDGRFVHLFHIRDDSRQNLTLTLHARESGTKTFQLRAER